MSGHVLGTRILWWLHVARRRPGLHQDRRRLECRLPPRELRCVHMRWRFQNWRGWKILRPGLILLVILHRKETNCTSTYIDDLFPNFLFYFFQDNSRTLLPLIYPPVATRKGSAYLLLLFMVLFYGQGSAFRVYAYVFGSPSLYYLPPFWVTTYTLPGWRFCNFACDTYYSCCML